MKKYLRTCLLSAFVFLSITATAQEWVKAQLIASHGVENGASTSAKLANLSPMAIQKGLRDTQMLADVSFDEKTRVLTYKWHSLVKDVKGTEYAQALTEPLISQVKAPVNVEGISAGQELIAKGDIESMLADFDLLLSKAQDKTEIDASRSLNQETNNELDGGGGRSNGGSSGGGFLGDNGGLTENPNTGDVDLSLDQIVEKVESCSMKVDLTNMVISKQERVIKTSSESGAIVEVGECKNVGQAAPIRKDFEAGCSLKVDKQSGEYIKGFKLYAMMDGSRYDISECEWEDTDAVSYDVVRDLEKCPLDKAIVNADRGIYYPAFVKYTIIDGKRFDLSDCETSDTLSKPLPTKIEMCENLNDLSINISYAQQRTDTYDPAFKNVLKKTSCTNTGAEYPIERDYEFLQCSDLPNYTESKLYKGYKNFYLVDGKARYIDGCKVDMDKPVNIFQETGTCRASENLTDKVATIKKRWAYIDEIGKKQYLTDCVDSEETYPIVTTENTCSPEYLSDINKVIIKDREGWQNGAGEWSFVSECRANGTEQAILTETCDNPKYEHDYVGGQSYLRSRDYYNHNGKKNYLNNCGRDTAESFAHYKTTTGCAVQHDDTNLRSQIFSKTMADLQEGTTQLKDCESESQYIPYQYTGDFLSGKKTQSFNISTVVRESRDSNCGSVAYSPPSPRRTIKSACDAMSLTSTYGKSYKAYDPSSSTMAGITYSCSTRTFNCTGNNCSGFMPYEHTITWQDRGFLDTDIKDWRRSDGSIYRQYNKYTCSSK